MWFIENYKETLKKAGIDYLPPNCCRHTTATALVELNISPTIIQSVMRHTKATTAMENHTHINAETKHEALQKL